MDWEDWLRRAARRPSDHEASKRDRTEQQIRDALSAYEPLQGRQYRVYAKGSYANNTNVRLNYDVDIAVEYYGFFYYDLALDLKDEDKSTVGLVASADPYTRADFKADILAAMRDTYGASSVEVGKIAYRIRNGNTTLPADVVPSWEYRRYDGFRVDGSINTNVGSRVYPSDGGWKNNFPKLQVDRGTAKNSRTGRRYKRMVRCLKKLQTKLVADGVLRKELPSYLIECVVFNVPDSYFNNATYLEDMRAVLGYLWGQTRTDGNWNDWEEVHGLHYLFRGDPSWTHEEVHELADKAWDAVGIK